MASISTDPKGNRTIQFVGPDKKRRSIRLGKQPVRVANEIKSKVEALNAANVAGISWDRETAEWLGGRGAGLYDKLAGVGLVPDRKVPEKNTLGPFVDRYIESRQTIKPNTVYMLKYASGYLVGFLGAHKSLEEVTEGDADMFRQHLSKSLAENTVRLICRKSRQFFGAAMKHRLISANPFGSMKGLSDLEDHSRMRFVTRAEIDAILEQCADPEFRLLIALSRYGGLRTPTEPQAMKWGDIDWERSRITVRCVKTERHEGKATRVIPMFPELLPHLEAAYDAAAEGSEYVITRHRAPSRYITRSLHALTAAAGLKPWLKPWNNMRSTRETELAEQYPLHVVCRWIGNNVSIAAKNYLQTTDVHFDHACALHNPVQQPAAVTCSTRKPK